MKLETRSTDRCSTPFGIEGYWIEELIQRAMEQGECSTPFGIEGYWIVTVRVMIEPRPLCSTPFGIEGYWMRNRRRLTGRRHVLNAFRH